MRVAFNVEQLLYEPPGGVGRYTAKLARLLPTLADPFGDGEHIELAPFVALHRRREVHEALGRFGLETLEPVAIPLPRPVLYDLWHLLGAPSVQRASRGLRRVDLIHAPSLAVPPRGSARLVVTAHDAAPLLFPSAYPRRGRWFHARGLEAAARRADLVITVSHAAAAELAAHTRIEPERLRVVPNGVDLEVATDDQIARARTELGIGDGSYVLWLGSFEPRKNVRLLVDAFSRLVERSDLPHRLVLAGPAGWLGERSAVLGPAGALGDRVCFTGPVAYDLLAGLYRGADLFAFPSVHEGFGLPVLEAMSQGTAVLCADIPALREVGGDAVRLLPPRDADRWAGALERLLTDDAERGQLAAAGPQRAALFSWARCAERTAAVYRDVVDR
jgi:glycosyltransferase involved in cell wall biosynthesis